MGVSPAPCAPSSKMPLVDITFKARYGRDAHTPSRCHSLFEYSTETSRRKAFWQPTMPSDFWRERTLIDFVDLRFSPYNNKKGKDLPASFCCRDRKFCRIFQIFHRNNCIFHSFSLSFQILCLNLPCFSRYRVG